MRLLLPRLSAPDARAMMLRYEGRTVSEIATLADASLADVAVSYAATGGNRWTVERASELRTYVRELAARYGYPGRLGTLEQRRFDYETALFLRVIPDLQVGEAIRSGSWQYISTALLPDLVWWRFPPEKSKSMVTDDRYLGGNRNCFGRLWQRAFVFWDNRLADPAVAIAELREDNFVSILERSAFSMYLEPCREIARAFLLRRPLVSRHANSSDEKFLRDAMCRFVRLSGHRALWAIDDEELRRTVAGVMDQSLRAFGIEPQPEAFLLAAQPALRIGDVGPGSTPLTFRPEALSDAVLMRTFSAPTSSHLADRSSFLDLSVEQREEAVWEALVGQDEQSLDTAIRVAAQSLRAQGRLTFERLREGGAAYEAIRDAINRGGRSGRFTTPARGMRKASPRADM